MLFRSACIGKGGGAGNVFAVNLVLFSNLLNLFLNLLNLFVGKNVREPIQVYMTETERAELDRLAAVLGVSRSEILRRGVTTMRSISPGAGPLSPLVAEGIVTPARVKSGSPPIGDPVAPLCEILRELDVDREDR